MMETSLGFETKFVESDIFIFLSVIKICLTLRISIERDLTLLSLMQMSLDFDYKFVECEANFAARILYHNQLVINETSEARII